MQNEKPVVLLGKELDSLPMSVKAKIELAVLLTKLQVGENLSLPHSRPMPSIGRHVHELRIRDVSHIFRVFYRIDSDYIVIVYAFSKTMQKTPKQVIDLCKHRLRRYDLP